MLATDAESVMIRLGADPTFVLSDVVSLALFVERTVMEKGSAVPLAVPVGTVAVRVRATLPPEGISPNVQLTAGGNETPPLEALANCRLVDNVAVAVTADAAILPVFSMVMV